MVSCTGRSYPPPSRYHQPMVEIGIAILFLGVLLAADRARTQQLTEKVREFLDWVERSSNS